MKYLIFAAGIFLILCGLIIKKKKWMWIHLGIRKKQLDTEMFIKHIYIVDIVFGVLICIIGLLYNFIIIARTVFFITIIINVIVNFYVENKYEIK